MENNQAREEYLKRLQEAEAIENNRTDFQKTDLSPLMALVDSEFGSNLSRGYKRPKTDAEIKNAQAERYKSLLSRSNSITLEDRIALENAKNANKMQFANTKGDDKSALLQQKYKYMTDLENTKNKNRLGYFDKTEPTKHSNKIDYLNTQMDLSNQNAAANDARDFANNQVRDAAKHGYGMERDNNKYANLRQMAETKHGYNKELLGTKNEARKEIAAIKNTAKDGKFANDLKHIPKDKRVFINDLTKSNANKSSILSQLEADWDQLAYAPNEDVSISYMNQMIKTLNSKEGKDAVGAEEAKRLGSLLQYKIANFTEAGSFIGRDVEDFKKQIGMTMAGIKNAIDKNDSKIQKVKDQYGGDDMANPKVRLFMQRNNIKNPKEAIRILENAGKL